MTAQDIAQVVADAVEREGLDADEVLVAVDRELRRRFPEARAFVVKPPKDEPGMVFSWTATNAQAACDHARRIEAIGTTMGHFEADPWNGMGPGRPPVCVSCGGPRDRADSDSLVALAPTPDEAAMLVRALHRDRARSAVAASIGTISDELGGRTLAGPDLITWGQPGCVACGGSVGAGGRDGLCAGCYAESIED